MINFTIIIPHYNIPDLLQRCLDSIPDIPDIQVIVVDNNSSSEKVDFNKFPGLDRKYTEVIFDKEGRGAGHARNVALPRIKGKWVMFSDSDDLMAPNFYEEICKYKDADADSIFFKVRSVDSDTLHPDNNRDYLINNLIDECLSGKEVPYRAALQNSAPWGKMIRASLITNNNIDFEEVKYSNDVMFSVKVACLSRNISVVDFVLYLITTRTGSLASEARTNSHNYLSRMEVYARRNKYLKSHGKPRLPLFLRTLGMFKQDKILALRAMLILLRYGTLSVGMYTFIKSRVKKIFGFEHQQ